MESYMVMLYVTIEQEIELKKFFMNRGWPYCKTDLSMMTDHIGPLTGQVPHLTRQTLGLGPSLSPTLTEAQLVQLEAHRKRAAEHEAETPPPKKQVPEPVSTSTPTTILAPAAPAPKAAIAKTPAPAAPSPAVVALVPSAIGDAGGAVRAGSSPQRLSQEKEMLVEQEPVRVKMEPGDLKTYSKVKQRVDDKETPSGKVQGKPIGEKTPVTTKDSQVLKLVSLIPATGKPPGVKVVHATEILAGRTIVHSSPTSPVLKTGPSHPSTPIAKPANSQKDAEGVASQTKKKKGREQDNAPIGPNMEKVSKYVEYLKLRGFLITKDMIKDAIIKTIRSFDNHPIFSKGPESSQFLDAAIESAANIKAALEDGSGTKTSDELKAEYTKCLQDSISRLNLHNNTKNIYYCFQTYWKTKEESQVELTTAMICVALNGSKLPPCIIFEKNLPKGAYKDGLPKAKWLHLSADIPEVTNEIFSKWFNYCFLGTINLGPGSLLLMDGSWQSVGLEDWERLSVVKKIDILGLPWQPDLAKLSPANWGLSKSLKDNVLKVAEKFSYVDEAGNIDKSKFSVVLYYAMDLLKTDDIVNAFASAGVCDLRPVKQASVTKADVSNGLKKAK